MARRSSPAPLTPPTDARPLEDIVMRDWRGVDVRLGDRWADGPVLLVFLRHYGWAFCRHHAVQLNRDSQLFAEAGAPLLVIGQSTPGSAAHFRRELDLDLDLLADTDRRAYKAAGTKVGSAAELIGPRVVARGLRRALSSRVFQGRTVGHPAQLGGLMLVTPGGDVPWAHLSSDASDYPPNAEVLAAVRTALAPAARRPAA